MVVLRLTGHAAMLTETKGRPQLLLPESAQAAHAAHS